MPIPSLDERMPPRGAAALPGGDVGHVLKAIALIDAFEAIEAIDPVGVNDV